MIVNKILFLLLLVSCSGCLWGFGVDGGASKSGKIFEINVVLVN